MDINLILSAQTLRLAPELRKGELDRGLFVLKNVTARTYLRVTPEQWLILCHFEKPQMVPAVLGTIIRDRQCIPLGEFFELILKALRANILLEPGVGPEPVLAHEWSWTIRPKIMVRPIAILFLVGMLMALFFHPSLPTTFVDAAAGLGLLCAGLSFGNFLAGCMIRGAGGEVYRPSWRWLAFPPHFGLEKDDAVMLPPLARALVALAVPSMLATAAGISSLDRQGWAFFPMLGLMYSLRPVMGGRINSLIQAGSRRSLSDAEESHIFPPNGRPEVRVRLLSRTLRCPSTWLRLLYAVAWAFALLYWSGRVKGVMFWNPAFWQAYGIRIALGVGGSLVLLGIGYGIWEMYLVLKETARTRRRRTRAWARRWLSRNAAMPDESTRLRALAASPVFGSLQPPERTHLARIMGIRRHGPWKLLASNSGTPAQVSLIMSGKVSVRRALPSGRTVQVQVLSEGDTIGLHDLADPAFPHYALRTLTPVTLMSMDRKEAEERVVSKVPKVLLPEMILKFPFLRNITLCRHWHIQAVKRFARLSVITNYVPDKIILSEGQAVEDFFIIFQGDARVTTGKRQLAVIHSGEFFGEIGLMQNSMPNASVTARNGTRCLSIPRTELLKFVTHNYSVALELERVSSKRLGRPLFPLKPGDFRGI